MGGSVRFSNDFGQIRSGLYVLIFLLFTFSFFVPLASQQLRPENPIPRKSEKTIVSIDHLPDPITKILILKHDKQSFNIDIWTDKKRYRVGEEIRFYFRSDRDCYLTLIDYETNGNVKVLFPNRYYQDNLIRVGKTYIIPGSEYGFKLTAAPPPGIERIKAIATTKPFSLFDIDFAQDFFPKVDKSNTRDMRSVSTALDTLSSFDWAENSCTVSIR